MGRRHNQGLVLVRGGASRRHNQGIAAIIPTTWNPLDKGAAITLSGGNLVAQGSGSVWASVRGTQSRAGDRYFELVSSGEGGPGFANPTAAVTTFFGADTNGVFYHNTGDVYYNGATLGNIGAHVTGDVLGCLISNGQVWFLKNGVAGNGNPSARTGGLAVPGIGTTVFPGLSAQTAINSTARFLPASFTGAIPTGAKAWDS